MAFLSIFLASLMTTLSPVGLIVDQRLESKIRSQLRDVETLEVRVDNVPSYRFLQGKVQRLRIASEGLQLTPHLRIHSFALETDPIAVDIRPITSGEISSIPQIQQALQQPFRGAFQVTIRENDLNQFLNAPSQKAQIEARIQTLVNQITQNQNQRYELLRLEVDFLDANRVAVTFDLRISRNQNPDQVREITLGLESGLTVKQGKYVTLVEPNLIVNEEPALQRLVNGVSNAINQKLKQDFNLADLEQQEIIARVLQLKIQEDELKLAAFVQVANETAGE